jgi:hypothetical protein
MRLRFLLRHGYVLFLTSVAAFGQTQPTDRVPAPSAGLEEPARPNPPSGLLRFPHLADYDAELRRTDGHVELDRMVHRLHELGVTTYYWLVWHAATDWDDLKLFLPKAAQEGLEVWVYLVPPSEGPPHGYPASEPFKLDYPRWAEEIARLSLSHTNLTGWVIDDFYANHQVFTPGCVRQFQARAKAINPRLAFLPLMYFSEITRGFARDYHDAIDGVVVAYPQGREEIDDARAILNGASAASCAGFACPWNTATRAGDFVSASTRATVSPGRPVRVSFRERDDFTGSTRGYHFKQLLVDDAVVWEQDAAGGAKGWQTVDVDLADSVRGRTNVLLTFRLMDKQGVSNFGLRWALQDLRLDGLAAAATLAEPELWKAEHQGPLEAGFALAPKEDPRSFHIPLIVMTAASTDEFRLRHGDPASPERIADWLRMSLQAWHDGQCDGVVTYCLDKSPASPAFALAESLFHQARPAR